MSHPEIVQSALGDESVVARIDLGDDALFVTPTRTLVYRADSLLSDESVGEFPHGAERISVSAGRRKATVSLDYGLDGEQSFTVPVKQLDKALHPVLAGTLNATGVTGPGETVKETFRFSELTLVITSDRLVKHIGNAVWDEEFEEYHYDTVTDLAFEEGNVATTVVLTHDGRQERFKAPNERARELRERLTQAVLTHHEVDSLATLRERFADESEEERPSATMSFGEGPTPLSANPGELREKPKNATRTDEPADAEPTAEARAAGTTAQADAAEAENGDEGESIAERQPVETAPTEGESAGEQQSVAAAHRSDETTSGSSVDRVDTAAADTLLGSVSGAGSSGPTDAGIDADDPDLAALAAEVEALRESVDAQNDRIARQEELIERLIAELRGRL